MVRQNHSGIYGVILDKKGDHVLLVRNTHGPNAGILDLPGGTPDIGESPEQTLQRSVKAQTGCEIREFSELEIPDNDFDSLGDQPTGKVFAATLIDLPPITRGRGSEGAAWITVNEIENHSAKTTSRVSVGLDIARQLRRRKILTIFGGSPTLGKTTLLTTIKRLMPHAHILVPSMCREARADDNPDFLRACDPQTFESTLFWSRQTNTGIAQSEVDKFLASSARFGFCIAGHLELLSISHQRHPVIQIHTVLLRMAEDPLAEAIALGANITLYHGDPLRRLHEHLDFLQMIRDQPDQFANIDHMLFRTNTLPDWIRYLNEHIGLGLGEINIAESIYNDIIQHSSEIRPARGNLKISSLLKTDKLLLQ